MSAVFALSPLRCSAHASERFYSLRNARRRSAMHPASTFFRSPMQPRCHCSCSSAPRKPAVGRAPHGGTPEVGAKAAEALPTHSHRLAAPQVILVATTTGQAATIGANRSFIWSGGCARCYHVPAAKAHSGSELRLRVGNYLLVYHPLCFAQRGCATRAQQDHAT
jgi:hypothetical protein